MEETKPFTSKIFHDFLNEEKLMGVKCKDCGKLHLPPKPVCPSCGSQNLTWLNVNGVGSIEAFTIVHVPPKRLAEAAPYIVAIVRFDQGPRISGRVIGTNAPEQVQVGSRVKIEFAKEEDGKNLAFKLI